MTKKDFLIFTELLRTFSTSTSNLEPKPLSSGNGNPKLSSLRVSDRVLKDI